MLTLQNVFKKGNKVAVSATKSMIGHLLGAAGAIEAIACIKAIQEGVIPPTINTLHIEPGFDDKLNIVLGNAKKKEITYAMSNTFGFGGHIASSIFKKWM